MAMRRFLLMVGLSFLLLVIVGGWAGTSFTGGFNPYIAGSTVVSDTTCIVSDVFDEADGTNISTLSGWGGSASSDALEIDTAYYRSGTGSFMVVGSSSGSENGVRTFSELTSGVYTIELYNRFASNLPGSGFEAKILGLYDGGTSSAARLFHLYAKPTIYYTDGADESESEVSVSSETFVMIEIEIDLDNDTYSVWYNDVNIITDADFRNTGLNPDRLVFETWTNYDPTPATQWNDDLCIYSGSRQ